MVDTSDLIQNPRDIFTTKKVACMLENDQFTNMITSSPTRNILAKIYDEKTLLRPDMIKERAVLKRPRCLLFRDPSVFQLLKSDLFLVGERTAGNLLMSSSFLFEGMFKKLFVNQKSIYEYNLVGFWVVGFG